MKKIIKLSFILILLLSLCSCSFTEIQNKVLQTVTHTSDEKVTLYELQKNVTETLVFLQKEEFISLFSESVQSNEDFKNKVEQVYQLINSNGNYGKGIAWENSAITPIYSQNNNEIGWAAWDSVLKVNIMQQDAYATSKDFTIVYYYQTIPQGNANDNGILYFTITLINSNHTIVIGKVPNGESIPADLKNT